MTHVVFSLERETFLTKPQQEKAGIYKEKKKKRKKQHISCQSLFNSLFKVFSFPLLPFLINTTTKTQLFALIFKTLLHPNMRKFPCNPLRLPVCYSLYPHTETIHSAGFLVSTKQLAVEILLTSVPEAGLTDVLAISGSGSIFHPMQPGCTAYCIPSCFQTEKGENTCRLHMQEITLFIWKTAYGTCKWCVWALSYMRPGLRLPHAGRSKSRVLVKPHANPITFPTPWRSRLLLQHVTPMTSLQTRRFLLF